MARERTTKTGDARPRDASSVPETEPEDTREPHEINSSLSSDRMQALLDDHRKMGSRP